MKQVTDDWIRINDPILWQRHMEDRILVYFRPKSKEWITREQQWLKSRSISTEVMRSSFMKVRAAAAYLGISAAGVRSAISLGRIAGPRLFDYSPYSDSRSFDVYVPRRSVATYASTRRRRRQQ